MNEARRGRGAVTAEGGTMGRWTGKQVAVLYGGRSSEREVSLKTGAACAEALASRGLAVTLVDAGLDVAERLRACGAEVAFIALHGRHGEDGSIQGLLESMGIPYTGSGVLASAVAMDKVISKLLFKDLGLAVAEYRVFPPAQALTLHGKDFPFTFPVVVKPACEGSSVGVSLVKDPTHLAAACAEAARWKGEVIVEKYVKGKEVQVAVLDGQAMGVIEVVPANEFYDYAAKYTAGTTQYYYPARISEADTRKLMEAAELAHRGLGCAGVTRTDFILTAEGTAFILEVNTLPGMTASSLVPKIAAGNGLPFPELCERLLDGAALKG
jgi:D-alanine-D-alanine ligase